MAGASISAKRRYTPVPPVVHDGVRYEQTNDRDRFGQYGGVLAAYDVKTNDELWTLKVYQTEYDNDGMEHDVQDVFLTTLSINDAGTQLHAENEMNQKFIIDISSQSVCPVGVGVGVCEQST